MKNTKKLGFLKKPEWIASILVVIWTFALSSYAFTTPPAGCTPGSCDNPLTVDFAEQTVTVSNAPTASGHVANKAYVDNTVAGVNVNDADYDPANEIQNLQEVLAQNNDAGGTTITNLPAPTANSDASTKDYVDSTVAAAGGSGGLPQYIVANTTASYNGDLGGRAGANEKCRAQFGSTAVMFGTQHVNCYTKGTCILDYRIISESWFDVTNNTSIGGASTETQDLRMLSEWNDNNVNCYGWTSDASTVHGSYLNNNGYAYLGRECHRSYKIACAYTE